MKICPKCGLEYPDTTTLCPADGVALTRTEDTLVGKTLAGKYRIEERLKEGGMGTVYRGTHVLMDKTVAIKVLLPSLAADEKVVARFSREARAASRISHPNALSVTDFGEAENGIVFLVMEYLSGKTLKQLLHDEGPLPLARAVDIMRQVGDALEAAHEQGVVHRDLKSDNIMLISTAGGDHAKVLDFGIAKIKEREGEYDGALTAPNLVIGTPQYMSPEQCSQAPDIDARSDIYSFGVILYEILVGHVPFTGDSPTSTMLKQLQEPAPSVLVERKDLPVAIGRVVAKALAKSPADRYQTVTELLEDLIIASGLPLISPLANGAPQTSVTTFDNELDEVTVVRPRAEPIPPPRAPMTVPVAPLSTSSLNPLKILIPSAIALLVVFAVFYAFTRNSESGSPLNANQPQTLVADPNSQPVQPAQPPTGTAEQGIPAGGAAPVPANTNKNENLNAAPSPAEAVNENVNTNENVNENTNENRKAPSIPSPTRTTVPEVVPAPTPSGSKSPASKPSPAPPSSSPTSPG
ncbi:MAG: protein kinase [Pyrinomonadaceae bacterium]